MKEGLSVHESVTDFLAWCQTKGIKRVLIDGDDTVWGIIKIFGKFLDQCYDFLAQETGVCQAIWQERLTGLDDQYFEQYGVNPLRWTAVMTHLAKDYPLPDEVGKTALEILMQIYDTPPSFLPGSEEGLRFLKLSGVPFSLVTHANKEWTDRKIEWLGLSQYFSPENIWVIDENGHKTSESWTGVIESYNLKPEECAVIGDSPRSDINPARQAGVKHVFLLKTDVPIWSVHNQPVETDVIIISSLNQLMKLKP